MTPRPRAGSLLQDLDLDKKQLLDLLTLAGQLKRDKEHGDEMPRLRGKSIVLVFEERSTRTRCSFEVAAHDQGAQVTHLGPEGPRLGREESVADTARVLGRLFDGIAVRGHTQETAEQFARHAGVPVWNALTDLWHPTRSLADILTMIEHHGGGVEDIAFCFTGDGRRNVARSLLVTGALLGMDVRIASPAGRQPPPDVVAAAEGAAVSSGARLLVTDDLRTAVHGADFVYTAASNRPGVRFMHCRPAILDRGTAIDQMFESARSIVFDQAENRMHTIKAVLVRGLKA